MLIHNLGIRIRKEEKRYAMKTMTKDLVGGRKVNISDVTLQICHYQ